MDLPRGVTWGGEWRVDGVRGWQRCAFSGDGEWLLAGGGADGGALIATRDRSATRVAGAWGYDVAWDGVGERFLIAVPGGARSYRPHGRPTRVDRDASLTNQGAVRSLACALRSGAAAVGHDNGAVHIERGRSWKASEGQVYGIAWSPDGARLLTASWDDTLVVWDAAAGSTVARADAPHGGSTPNCARRAPPGTNAAWMTAGGMDIRLWDEDLRLVRAIELGGLVAGLELHPTLPLLAWHGYERAGVVRTDSWSPVATWPTSGARVPLWPPLAFHPTAPLLVARGPDAASLAQYRLDLDLLLGARRRPGSERRYQAAKVVLLGDSGVGKTGLGWVLAGQPYRVTSSTHKRLVHALGTTEGRDGDAPVTRETVLWDLAGQPGYRLVHHLHLRDVAVALLVIDGTAPSDPLAGARYWARALARRAAREGVDAPPMLLVCARGDRGPVRLAPDELDRQAAELGATAVHLTSAQTGDGVAALRAAVAATIAWGRVPIVHSDVAYANVRALVGEAQAGGGLLVATDALHARYAARQGAPPLTAEAFAACLRGLEGAGTVRWLGSAALWLLQPEALDALAGALVHEAAREADGLGELAEARALTGQFRIPPDADVADEAARRTLLRAAVEDLLAADVVLREETADGAMLVLPTESTRVLDEDPAGRAVGSFAFGGAVPALYATTVVRLAHSGVLLRPELYRDAARLPARIGGGSVTLRVAHRGDGLGQLELRATPGDAAVLALVEGFVHEHLLRRALPGTVRFRRAVACPGCGLDVPDQAVAMRRARQLRDVQCSGCDHRFPLPPEAPGGDPIRPPPAPAGAPAGTAAMGQNADRARERETAAVRLAARKDAGKFDVFLSYSSADGDAARKLAARLAAAGLYAWVDWEQIRLGTSPIVAMETGLKACPAALVLFGPNGLGPWQDVERRALLTDHVRRGRPLIPVLLPRGPAVDGLPPLLQDLRHVDLRPQNGDRAYFEDPFDELVRTLLDLR